MSDERRDTFRCQVPETESLAILRTGKTDLVVNITEQSAGGFTATSEKKPTVKAGSLVSIATGTSCCEAKVIHVTQHGDETRIGLQRIRELKFRGRGLKALIGHGRDLAQLAMVAGLCLVFYLWGSKVSPAASWWPARDNGANKASVNDRQENEQVLAMNYLRLDQLKSNKFVEQLEITEIQQKQINVIAQETTSALASLYDQRDELSPQDWAGLGLQLIQTTWDEIQSVLTQEQRDRWKAIVNESSEKPLPEHQAAIH